MERWWKQREQEWTEIQSSLQAIKAECQEALEMWESEAQPRTAPFRETRDQERSEAFEHQPQTPAWTDAEIDEFYEQWKRDRE